MGFTKEVAEKALFHTLGKGLEGAMDWIQEHQEDPDFFEELRIVGQSEDAPKSTLTKEEKLAKAKELQDQARMKRL